MNAPLPATDRDITLFVPALNEARRIEATVRGLITLIAGLNGPTAQILVVDDGSTDATAEIVRRLSGEHRSVELVQHPVNRGLGSGLKTALSHARGRKFLIVPGDNDMPASALRTLIANAGAADMVMCYFHNREQRGRTRNALSTIFGLVYASCFDVYVQYINGPCVYTVHQLRALTLNSTRFSIVAEINIKLLRQGVSYIEIPTHRQVGLDGSRSFSFRNLRETIRVFMHLLNEVHRKEAARYRHRPRRILADFTLHPVQNTGRTGGSLT